MFESYGVRLIRQGPKWYIHILLLCRCNWVKEFPWALIRLDIRRISCKKQILLASSISIAFTIENIWEIYKIPRIKVFWMPISLSIKKIWLYTRRYLGHRVELDFYHKGFFSTFYFQISKSNHKNNSSQFTASTNLRFIYEY